MQNLARIQNLSHFIIRSIYPTFNKVKHLEHK